MNNRRKILIVNRERQVCDYVKPALENKGYDVITASTGREGKAMAESHCPDLILLGRELPDLNGVNVIREIREWSEMPVIMFSSGGESAVVEALENGADDFVTVPFRMGELLSRINLAFRHTAGVTLSSAVHDNRYEVGNLVIDYEKYRVYIGGRDVSLTQNEFKIVALLGKNAGRVIPYDYIITQLWGPNVCGDNQILRVNMANIRRKIEEDTSRPRYIFTETGVGYRMADK